MTDQILVSLAGIGATGLVGFISWLLRRALRLQDEAQVARDQVGKQRHEELQQILRDQRQALENEIRATRSDVRLVVGDVAEHGRLIAGAAATLEALAGRTRDAEEEIRKLVRDGCAHRKTCEAGK